MDFPLFDVFVSMLWFFAGVLWVFLVGWAIFDVCRRADLGAWGKVAWLVLVILVPFVGVIAYLIAHGAHLAGEQVRGTGAPQDEAARAYERFEAQGHIPRR